MPRRLRLVHSANVATPAVPARRLAAGRIRRLRHKLGLTQEEAARICDVSERTWRDWERWRCAMRPLEAVCVLEQMAAERKAA